MSANKTVHGTEPGTMTYICIAKGVAWSSAVLYHPDRLGGGEGDARFVGDKIRSLFDAAVAALGRPDIHWQPSVSEVTGHACDYPEPGQCKHKPLNLLGILGVIDERVYDAYCDGGRSRVAELTLADLGDLAGMVDLGEEDA
jgi:hypothetical protein